jgi:2-polyprenyl-3-methyl-5-hydroxy-6-metoxy-1,4-benzoquinol methylase
LGLQPETARPSPGPRRTVYQAHIVRGDFFVLRGLKAFLERAIAERVQPGTAVLDVGCGEQPLRPLIEGLGATYTGVDVGQNSGGTVDVVADIGTIPLPDASYGVVLCTEVLEHIADPSAAFAEMRRLCRPDGAIILTTPFAYPLHEEPHDFVRLTPHAIRECAAQNGLQVAELITSGDELQVIATVWCNLWTRSGGTRSRLRSAWNLFMRLPLNLLVMALTPLLHSRLPRKYFLSTCCVLLRQS